MCYSIGPKIASFLLRDIVHIYNLYDYIEKGDKEEMDLDEDIL